MEPELEVFVDERADGTTLSSIADLYLANLDVRDPKVLKRAYEKVIGSVPDQLKELYAEVAGIDDH
ncbi:MAG: hypothetical protein WDO56_34725 [Gammaproteobacteria bacterium]